ncbi:acyl-CoA dehydrogenase family protein [Nocardioides daejeonensis]|uniref:acyl-CoA dehydrogenase family protein n=1 Tax=Nocardioides daejeonensis TaxID=1046556 RepID=UPI000D74FCF1|nr:acyl-CoA dehydrogenase family protein [Nocardioides daejeonensis]
MTDSGSEVEDFRRAVAGVLEGLWPTAVEAGEADAAKLTEAAVQQGWYQLGEAGAIDYLIGAVRVLGQRACPLPLADAYVAARLFSEQAEAIGFGELRPVVVAREAGALVDDLGTATHLLVLDDATRTATLRPVASAEPREGLAVPALTAVTGGESIAATEVDASEWSRTVAVLRLAVAARAVAAAGRAHELAVEHAQVREQFGKVIGGFGAVQQRVASCHIELSASGALLDEAVGALLAERKDAPLAAALAARHARTAAQRIIAGAQHTLGAVGFFEEHEASWLFRRVHADVSHLGAALLDDRRSDGVAGRLLDGESLPHFHLGGQAERFREEVRALLARHRRADADPAGGVLAEYDAEALRTEMDEQALFALNWPEEHGGRVVSVEEQVVLHEEMKYAGGPVDRSMSATMLIGHSLLRHGTADQKAQFLPLLHAGQMAFCLGYSEPEAGSDLASLRTRAVRDGDEWVIDGQKLWTTRGHTASHVWLAVRTDPAATPRHAGITIFLVPMDTPGITVQQHVALSGEISCTVFYDRVRVPDSCRVGEVNGGWKVITDALTAERVVMGGVAATLRRHFDETVALLRDRVAGGGEVDALDRDRIGWAASRLQAARALVLRATRSMDGGGDARIAGPMAAVLSGDLAEELGRTCLDVLGPVAMLAGRYEAALRVAPMYVIGGGTNDIQRGIIARGLGLPRE